MTAARRADAAPDLRVGEGRLRAATAALLAAMGSDDDEARIVSGHLLEANLKGHDSHGVGMIPHYVRNWTDGTLVVNQHLDIVRDDGVFIVGDGKGGHGQVVAMEITERAVERVREQGVAITGLHNAHHVGRVGTYGERFADAGLVSIHFVNVAGHDPSVAPFRGSDGRFLTNPICISVPAAGKTPPIILDFATSKVALGKVRVAMNKGEQMAQGILIDHKGRPTTDPTVMFEDPRGAVLTVGEHKGYGLALMADLLGGALSGGMTLQPANPRDLGIRNSMLAIVLDPARMGTLEHFKAEIDAVVDYYKASPPTDPDLPVLVAGEPERMSRADRIENGIPIDATTWQELRDAAETAGLGGDRFADMAR